MKCIYLLTAIILLTGYSSNCSAQFKETAQLATLSPTLLVIYSGELENYQKNHFLISTIGYMGSYLVFESKWKAALLTLALGATKELIVDGVMGRGEPLWNDMMWNTLGVGQGVVFTISLEF